MRTRTHRMMTTASTTAPAPCKFLCQSFTTFLHVSPTYVNEAVPEWYHCPISFSSSRHKW